MFFVGFLEVASFSLPGIFCFENLRRLKPAATIKNNFAKNSLNSYGRIQ